MWYINDVLVLSNFRFLGNNTLSGTLPQQKSSSLKNMWVGFSKSSIPWIWPWIGLEKLLSHNLLNVVFWISILTNVRIQVWVVNLTSTRNKLDSKFIVVCGGPLNCWISDIRLSDIRSGSDPNIMDHCTKNLLDRVVESDDMFHCLVTTVIVKETHMRGASLEFKCEWLFTH
jgi:hypothetical protein